MKLKTILCSILLVFLFFSISYSKTLNLYSEDSVFPLLKELSIKFEKQNPNVKVNLRLINSVSVLPMLLKTSKPDLIFTEDTYLLKQFSNIKVKTLAIDPIVIIYDKNLKLNDKNWMKILSKIQYGYSNPNTDPLGYYTNFIFSLYNKNNKTDIICKTKYLRDETTDLFWLMKSGNLDAIFSYKSFAVQMHLNYFEPPKPYNLADIKYNYNTVSYKLDNGKVIPGHLSSFGMGILDNRDITKKFVTFIYSKENQKYFKQLGLIISK